MEAHKVNGMGYLTAKWPLDPARTTLLFIHGAGGTGTFWQAQIEGLSARFNTVAIDLPGHGTSDGGAKDRIEDYAGAVVDFMKAMEVPNPIFCGFSLGGAIVLQVLLDHPELARASILICTGATMQVGPAIFESIQNDYSGFIDFICKLAVSKKSDPEIVRLFRENFLCLNAEAAFCDFQACNHFDVSQRLSSIAVPVLVVTAEDDKLTPAQNGAALERGIKNATRAHIIDAGHTVAMEKPDEVNEIILEFLDQTGL